MLFVVDAAALYVLRLVDPCALAIVDAPVRLSLRYQVLHPGLALLKLERLARGQLNRAYAL